MTWINQWGNDIPEDYTVNGLPWLTWIGLESRLNTSPGRQLRRPDYGIDLSPFIDRAYMLPAMRQTVVNGLQGLYRLNRVVVNGDATDVDIQIYTD